MVGQALSLSLLTCCGDFFLFRLRFILPLFLRMVTYANEFKTKEKQKLTEIKKLTATYMFQEFCVFIFSRRCLK